MKIHDTLARATIVLVVSLSACTLHTVNTQQEPLVIGTASFSAGDSAAIAQDSSPWWSCFDDSLLSRSITNGLDNNLTIVEALARLKAAEALSYRNWSLLAPTFSGVADSRIDWDNVDSGTKRTRTELNNYGAAFAWEIDLFGRLQSQAQARSYDELARREDLNSLKLLTSAQIAETYFQIVAGRQGLQLLQSQLDSAKELLKLTELRFEAGVATNVDILQQTGLVKEVESLVPALEQEIRNNENRLDLLLGQVPDGIDRSDLPSHLLDRCPVLAVGVPGDLLVNRPDLKAAFAELLAADADTGRAIAERLPAINIGGNYLKSHGDTVHTTGATVFADIFAPLIDFGQRRAEVRRTQEVYNERLARFSRLYLTAIEEVENTIYGQTKQVELITRFRERQDLLSRTLKETRARYEQGLTDYLPVLTAFQELQTIERVLVAQELQLIRLKIQLFRALGVGANLLAEQQLS